MLSEKKDDQAFLALVSKMNADDIIARLNLDAVTLAQQCKDRDALVASLEKLLVSTLEQMAVKGLLALI